MHRDDVLSMWVAPKGADQFGANEYSPPIPTTAPQRVSSARSVRTPVAVNEAFVPVAGDRGAALHMEQDGIPGVTDLTREQAERIDLGADVSPIALRFDTATSRCAGSTKRPA
jgi:hypothetical protein